MSCIITYKGNKYTQEQFKEYISSNKNEFSHIIASNKNVIDSFKRKMEGIDYVFSQSPELASIGSKIQYLQYLSTIFKTSKVKDIVYHGTDSYGFESFSKILLGSNTNAPSAKEGFFFAKNKEVSLEYFEEGKSRTYKEDELDYHNDLLGSKHKPINKIQAINDKWDLKILSLQSDFNDEISFADGDKETIDKTIELYEKLFAEAELNKKNEIKNVTKIYSVILNSTDPYIFDYKGREKRVTTYADIIRNAKSNNNDSVLLLNTFDPKPTDVYVVFEPEQIHILSSKKDLEMFRNFINFTKSEYAKYGDIQQFRDYIMSKNFAAIEEFLVVNNKIDRKC